MAAGVLTVGSLFAGIGGFDLGLERAGMRSVWQCEIDPYAIRVLEKHWPDVLRVRDVRDVGAGTVPYVDLICGGFPCQDLSVAGRGAGLAGERSGLWFEYVRVVGELRPRYVVVENVRALVARGLDVVLGTLAEIGYDAEWDCIPASAVGAPHQRDRVWLVAYPQRDELREQPGRRSGPRGEGPALLAVDGEERALADSERPGLEGLRPFAGQPQVAEPRDGRAPRLGARPGVEHVADAGGFGCEWRPRVEGDRRDASERGVQVRAAGDDGGSPWEHWAVEPDVGRVADGVPGRVDRLRCLGNALVPQIAEWIGRRIVAFEEGRLNA